MTVVIDDMSACIICGSSEQDSIAGTIRDCGNVAVLRCRRCGHAQLDPLPSAIAVKEYYEDHVHSIAPESHDALENKRVAFATECERHAQYIAGLSSSGNLMLDVGCGYGWLLQTLANRGFDSRGIEPSPIRRAIAKKHSSPVYASLTEVPAGLRAAVVNLFFVLEHVPDPTAFLSSLTPFLTKDSHLIIVVPNIDDYLVGLNDAYRAFYWKKAHLSYFCENSVRFCLRNAGYDCCEIQYLQRWRITNALHWLEHNRPQEPASVVRCAKVTGIEWLDTMYERELSSTKRTDTLLVRAKLLP